ncbi:MAG: DeoR/GlpR family DNA-binding transcription regulator [Anaerolineae bacterium]|nr:DeoR/GlpR transcriptional regulator [Anaerolineales bacterium]MCQ3972922.1 DeoR/GlpR transcriptional regulator [Anaerolineae bacterium]
MTKVLIPAQRRKQIQELLELHQVVQCTFLSEMLQVSEATIRRDLEWMESQGTLERTHGGATLSRRMPVEPEYNHSAQTHPLEKQWIGARAAALVEDGDTIFVNSGTTATQVVRHIRDRARVTVITNNVNAALEAQDADCEIILLGGSFRARAKSVVGRFASEALRQVYASKTFIGVDGLSLKYGCTTPINAEAELARLMIERTHGQVIVVADHSKWGIVSNFEMARLDQIHLLVTNEGFETQARAELAARFIETIIAGPETNGRHTSGV